MTKSFWASIAGIPVSAIPAVSADPGQATMHGSTVSCPFNCFGSVASVRQSGALVVVRDMAGEHGGGTDRVHHLRDAVHNAHQSAAGTAARPVLHLPSESVARAVGGAGEAQPTRDGKFILGQTRSNPFRAQRRRSRRFVSGAHGRPRYVLS